MPMRVAMSAVPFDDVASQLAQEVSLVAVARQVADRLVDQRPGLQAGGIDAHQADESRLARACVLAQRLAGGSFVALYIEQVVGDLEGEADVARIIAQVRTA